MVSVPPFLPSLRWYGFWASCRAQGVPESEAVACANRLAGIAGKEFARSSFGSSSAPVMLSVAVEGGSSHLKRVGAERYVRLSPHGNWPHVHLGAFEALYGRAPYYQHILPALRELYAALPERLSDFNRSLHTFLASFLRPESLVISMTNEAVVSRGAEIASQLDHSLSLIDSLMRFGPETNLALTRYYTEIPLNH